MVYPSWVIMAHSLLLLMGFLLLEVLFLMDSRAMISVDVMIVEEKGRTMQDEMKEGRGKGVPGQWGRGRGGKDRKNRIRNWEIREN